MPTFTYLLTPVPGKNSTYKYTSTRTRRTPVKGRGPIDRIRRAAAAVAHAGSESLMWASVVLVGHEFLLVFSRTTLQTDPTLAAFF